MSSTQKKERQSTHPTPPSKSTLRGKIANLQKRYLGSGALKQTPYTYEPLDPEAATIRIIALHPSLEFSAVPEITVYTKTLLDTLDQNYEALSYAWGSPADPQVIRVREKNPPLKLKRVFARPSSSPSDRYHPLSVTKNLDEALRYLRLENEDRILWIDAICINQGDDGEKSTQVRRMSEIYSRAARVVAWLGPEEILQDEIEGDEGTRAGTVLALRILQELSQKINYDWGLQQAFPTTIENTIWADVNIPLPYDEKDFRSLDCLFRRGWFERLWIWQEIQLASKLSSLICGRSTILWSDFRSAIGILVHKKKLVSILPEASERLSNVSLLCDYPNEIFARFPFHEQLFQTQHCKFTDPRDRIFALLSLLNKYERDLSIVPDYSKTVEQVYKDVALEYIKYSRDLNVLRYCDLAAEKLRNKTLPTWVPNWAARGSFLGKPGVSTFNIASVNTDCRVRQVGSDGLAVLGLEVGVVKEISVQDDASVQLEGRRAKIHRLMKKYAPKDILDSTYVGGGSTMEVFSRTMILNNVPENYIPTIMGAGTLSSIQEYVHHILSSQETFHLDSDSIIADEEAWIYQNLGKLRFFTIENGHMGMAPLETRAGDHIAILLGLSLVMVLRPIGQSYEVVGPCYIHGFMQGEALLGPLPNLWEMVLRYDEISATSYAAFINRENGEIRIEDPRVEGALPDGWERMSHTRDHCCSIFRQIESGQKTVRDPRVSLEALEKRGIVFEEFLLV